MRRGFAEAVCARYKADSTNLREILLLAAKPPFSLDLSNEPAGCMQKRMDDDENIYNFESMASAGEVALSSSREKQREVRRI